MKNRQQVSYVGGIQIFPEVIFTSSRQVVEVHPHPEHIVVDARGLVRGNLRVVLLLAVIVLPALAVGLYPGVPQYCGILIRKRYLLIIRGVLRCDIAERTVEVYGLDEREVVHLVAGLRIGLRGYKALVVHRGEHAPEVRTHYIIAGYEAGRNCICVMQVAF